MPPVDDPALNLEWIERLPEFELGERWHVREGGVSRVVWLMHEPPHFNVDEIANACRAWCGFVHPRAGSIRRVGRHGARLIVLVEDDRGPSLAQAAAHLAATGTGGVEREGWLVAQLITIADALGAMVKHRPHFVYRGLDASRLFVDHTGRGRLRAPVGVVMQERGARTVGQGVVVGEPHWMSPEQCLGHALTPASDVFALASLFVDAAAGVRPFDDANGNWMGVLMKIIKDPPVLPALHAPNLRAVLERAFAREPHHRYPHAGAFAAALYDCVPDAGDYDAVISDSLAAWWPTAPQADGPMPAPRADLCAMTWDDLQPTDRPDLRHCARCEQSVFQIRSLAAAVPLITGRHCIHFDPPE